jgi:hypothetical protein
LIRVALKGLFDDEAKEAAGPVGSGKSGIGEDPIQFLLNGIGLKALFGQCFQRLYNRLVTPNIAQSDLPGNAAGNRIHSEDLFQSMASCTDLQSAQSSNGARAREKA